MTWNPFNWTAEPFLALYVALAAVIFLWGFSLRSMIGPAASGTRQLSVLELAYLAGGARRLGDAVLLNLTSGNGATISSNDYKITVTNQAPLAILRGRPSLLLFQPGQRSNHSSSKFRNACNNSVTARPTSRWRLSA
jgi:uncharacterized protein (TIGR04222 family)